MIITGHSNFNSLLEKVLRGARHKMYFVTKTIHGRALTILMAGRLGANSLLGGLSAELLRMIAQILIWGSK